MEETDRPTYMIREIDKQIYRVIPEETWDAVVEALRSVVATLDFVTTNPITTYELRITKEALQKGRAALALALAEKGE